MGCTNLLYKLQNHQTFHREEKLVNSISRRERFVGLSSYWYECGTGLLVNENINSKMFKPLMYHCILCTVHSAAV